MPDSTSPRPVAVGAVMAPLMLVLFIATLDQTIVATALKGLGEALGDAAAAPWIATAYLLTSAVSTLIFGKLGDLFGRKPVFQAAVLIFTASSALCALAPTMAWLIALRAVQGIGGGGLGSLVMTIVADLVPGRERARFQAVLGIVPVAAIILGPLLGGLILDHLRWQWIFLINVPVGLVALLAIAARLHLPPRERHGERRRIDAAGALLCTVFSTALLSLAVLGGAAWPWLSWRSLGLGALGLAALAAYVRVEYRAAEPLTPPRLFRDPVFVISAVLFFLASAVLFVGMLFAPLMLQTVFGLSALAAGAGIVPLLAGLIAATAVSGALIARNGRYRIFLLAGAVLGALGLGALARTGLDTPLWAILAALAVTGAGVGFFIQVVVLAGQNTVRMADLGVATGALNFFKTYGGAAAGAVFGALLAARLPAGPHASAAQVLAAFRAVFSWAVPLMLLAFLLALQLRETPLSHTVIDIAEGRLDVPEY